MADYSKNDMLGQRLTALKNDLKTYLEKRVQLLYFDVSEELSRQVSVSAHRMAGGILLGVSLLFLMVALAIYLSDVLGYRWAGYVAVALPLLIAGLFFVNNRPKSFTSAIRKRILNQMLLYVPAEENVDEQAQKLLDEHFEKMNEGTPGAEPKQNFEKQKQKN